MLVFKETPLQLVVLTMFLGDVYSNRSKLVDERSRGPRGSNGGKICLLSQAAALLPGGRSYFHFNPQLLIDLSGGGGDQTNTAHASCRSRGFEMLSQRVGLVQCKVSAGGAMSSRYCSVYTQSTFASKGRV